MSYFLSLNLSLPTLWMEGLDKTLLEDSFSHSIQGFSASNSVSFSAALFCLPTSPLPSTSYLSWLPSFIAWLLSQQAERNIPCCFCIKVNNSTRHNPGRDPEVQGFPHGAKLRVTYLFIISNPPLCPPPIQTSQKSPGSENKGKIP